MKKKKKVVKPRSSSSDSSSSSSTSSNSSSSDSSASTVSRERTADRSSRGSKYNPVAKWKWRFSGKPGEDLYTFLDKVEESADVHGVDDATVLSGISLLLQGDAHTWFRSKKLNFTSWKVFKREIQAAFDPNQDDEHILEKISNLKQSSSETYVVFEARCEELFERLRRPLSGDEKLSKVLKGLHLFYRNRLVASRITSLRKLRKKCKELEQDKIHIQKLEEEKKRKDRKDLEKEVSRQKPTKVAAAEVSGSSDEGVDVAATSSPMKTSGRTLVPCWRCRKAGHASSDCPNRVFCSGCHQQDVLFQNCSRCARANAAGFWPPPHQENSRMGQQRGVPGPFNVPPPPLNQNSEKPLQVLQRDQKAPESK